MKKKYRVDIHRYGALNNTITMMVANHNDGISSFNLMDVVGLVNSLRCALPLSNQGFCHLRNLNTYFRKRGPYLHTDNHTNFHTPAEQRS